MDRMRVHKSVGSYPIKAVQKTLFRRQHVSTSSRKLGGSLSHPPTFSTAFVIESHVLIIFTNPYGARPMGRWEGQPGRRLGCSEQLAEALVDKFTRGANFEVLW